MLPSFSHIPNGCRVQQKYTYKSIWNEQLVHQEKEKQLLNIFEFRIQLHLLFVQCASFNNSFFKCTKQQCILQGIQLSYELTNSTTMHVCKSNTKLKNLKENIKQFGKIKEKGLNCFSKGRQRSVRDSFDLCCPLLSQCLVPNLYQLEPISALNSGWATLC